MLFAGAQDADSGYLFGHMDFADDPGHLRPGHDWGAVQPKYPGADRGDQLLCRHAAICRGDSRGCACDARKCGPENDGIHEIFMTEAIKTVTKCCKPKAILARRNVLARLHGIALNLVISCVAFTPASSCL